MLKWLVWVLLLWVMLEEKDVSVVVLLLMEKYGVLLMVMFSVFGVL